MTESEKIPDTDCIYLRNGKYYCKYMYDDIYQIKASERNCIVFLSPDKSIRLVLAIPLIELIGFLPTDIFIRVHRSYIVNAHHIDRIIGNRLYIGDAPIPIGREYKEAIYSRLNIIGA